MQRVKKVEGDGQKGGEAREGARMRSWRGKSGMKKDGRFRKRKRWKGEEKGE